MFTSHLERGVSASVHSLLCCYCLNVSLMRKIYLILCSYLLLLMYKCNEKQNTNPLTYWVFFLCPPTPMSNVIQHKSKSELNEVHNNHVTTIIKCSSIYILTFGINISCFQLLTLVGCLV